MNILNRRNFKLNRHSVPISRYVLATVIEKFSMTFHTKQFIEDCCEEVVDDVTLLVIAASFL